MSSSNDNVTSSNSSTSSERVLGRVKWFNSKAGYGFISITDGPRAGTDIFVHHSAINVENQQYRYLVQGEYVEFSILDTPNGNHDCQAASVCGIKSGKLMCETRREFKIARNNYKTNTQPQSQSQTQTHTPKQRENLTPVQQRRDKGREGNPLRPKTSQEETRDVEEKNNWTVASKHKRAKGEETKPMRGRPRKVAQ